MTCDEYKNALLLTAESNGKLDADLAGHLARCSMCRTTLRSMKELFSRIDSALCAQVNGDPPPGFLARLRSQLSKESASPGSHRVWHAAGVALALVLLAVFYPLVNSRESSAHGSLQTPTMEASQRAGIREPAHPGKDLVARPPHHSRRPAVLSATNREPEVLVPPDEQQAFEQFVACVVRHDAMAQAVVTPVANKTVSRNTELPQVPSVDIADLQLGGARQGWINQTDSSE